MIMTAAFMLALLSPQPASQAIAGGAIDDPLCTAPGTAYADNGKAVRLRYRYLADRGTPLLLAAGIGQQIEDWPRDLIDGLAKAGYRPLAYDGRDAGCSTHFTASGPIDWAAFFGALATGSKPATPYSLDDVASDMKAVLDAARVKKAQVVGVSGGATAALRFAAMAPSRAGGLVLVATNSGNPAHPLPADPARLATVPPPPPKGSAADAVIAYRIASATVLEGDEVRRSPTEIEQAAKAIPIAFYDPDATGRAGAVLIAAGDLRTMLATIKTSATIFHGTDDPLVSPAAGKDVADSIKGSTFVLVNGFGHSLPEKLNSQLVAALVAQKKGKGQ